MNAQLAPSANFVKHHAGQSGRNAVYSVLKHAMRDERGVGTHGNANVDDARISWNRNFVYDEESGGLVPGDYDDAMSRYFEVFGAQSREKEEKRLIEAEKRKYRRAKKRALEKGEDVPPEPDFSKLKLEQPRYPHRPSKGPGKLSARTNSATVSAVTWVLHPSVENGWFEETFPKWREDEVEREAVERMLMDYYESLLEALQMEERSVLGVSLNMDETTPHVHVVLASVDFDEKDKATPNWQRIGGGNRVEGPAKLEKVHDDYRAALRERGYDVTDVRVSEKGNVPGPRYGAMKDRAREDAKKDLEAEERALDQWREELQEWADDTEAKHAGEKRELAAGWKQLEAEKVVVAKDREANQQRAQDLDRREKAVAEREKAATEREEINAMDKQSNDEWGMSLFNSIQDLKQVKDRLGKEDVEKVETATKRVRDYRAGKPAPKKKAPQKRPLGSAPRKRPPGAAPQKQADEGDYGYG